MKKSHNITIAGVELLMNSDDTEDYVQDLAGELTRRINTAVAGYGVTKLQAAVACALELLDENCRLKTLLENVKQNEA